MGLSSIFNAVTFEPIKKLYGTPVATVVKPFSEWQSALPAGYVYVPEYDGFFSGTTRLANPSLYWTTDSVEYIPVDMSTDEYQIRYAAFIGIQHYAIGVLGVTEIAKMKAAFAIIIDSVEHRVEKSNQIHTKWC